MRRVIATTILISVLLQNATSPFAVAEQLSLMGMIAEWQFPGSTINGAEMADGETVDATGKRTIQSLVCKTVMTTAAPIEKVTEFYRAKLKPATNADEDGKKPKRDSGRSVLFSNDSDGRPFAIHTVIVNTEDSSTTLVITRGNGESKTHIAWKRYIRL
jgi:hypothetical protein